MHRPSLPEPTRTMRYAAAVAGLVTLAALGGCDTGALPRGVATYGGSPVAAVTTASAPSTPATVPTTPATVPSTAAATTTAAPTTAAPTTAAPTTAAPTTAAPSTPSPPAASAYHYTFPVPGCTVSYGPSHHDYPATDIFAGRGCPFVAVVDGTVDEVSARDTWDPHVNDGGTRGGRSVAIIGVDGVRYYGSHLDEIAPGIAPGIHVHAGQVLGRVGNSGDARGIATHVHFGISWPTPHGTWWVRRGEVSPYRYLRSWQAGGDRSPAAAVAALHAQDGTVPRCHADC